MKPLLVRPADAQTLNVLGVQHTLFVRGADSDGTFTLIDAQLAVGMGIPLHVHEREEELFYVTRGEVEFSLDDRTFIAAVGTTVIGPRNVPHSYRAAGDRPAAMTITILPSGIEDMFVELARLPAGAPDLARVAEICGRYGVSLL